MEVQVIILSALLSISKCAFLAVHPTDITNQRHFPQVNYVMFPDENNRSLPQSNFPYNINSQHVYKQNNLPINSQLNTVQNLRQLPIREVIQSNSNSNIQQRNLGSNNFLTNRIKESNSQIEQKPQLPIVKPGASETQLLAIKNRHHGINLPNSLKTEIPNGRLVNTKEIFEEYQAVPGIKKIVTNIPERSPVNQGYETNAVPVQNMNNVLLLGNKNKNINPKKILPIQQQVANKRYTLIRKNGAIEHYEDLDVILKKYPQIQLPQNLRQVPESTGTNNDLKQAKPYRNIPLNQYNNNIAATNIIDRPINLQKQFLQNAPKTSGTIQDNRYNTENSIAKTLVSDSIMHPRENQGGKIMHFTEQVLNAKPNLKNIQEGNNSSVENLAVQVNRVKEESVINLSIKNIHRQDKPLMTMETIVNKFEQPFNSTVNRKTNVDFNENIETTTSGLIKSPSDFKTPSNNKLERNTTTNDKNDKLLEQQSNPAVIRNVTKLRTACDSLDEEEKHTITADQEDSNEDALLRNTPVLWYTTNDSNFFDKLVEDSPNNCVYIINVQSHPKVEKDTKTIVHSNGTIVEEITESIWEYYDEEPKITKSVKITPAAFITKEKIVEKH